MNSRVDTDDGTDASRSRFPAYGPIDATLSFVVFYVFVDRATPTVVDVFTTAVPTVSPSLVRLGLAGALWFILAVTLADQVRRQREALDPGRHGGASRTGGSRAVPTRGQFAGYLVVLVLGGGIAAWTFEPAIRAGIAFIRVVATLDVSGFVLRGFVEMVVFFISFAGATRALDRLIVGSLRALVTD